MNNSLMKVPEKLKARVVVLIPCGVPGTLTTRMLRKFQPLAQFHKWSLYQVSDITECAQVFMKSLHKQYSRIREEINASEKDCTIFLALVQPHADNSSLEYLDDFSEIINDGL